MVELSKGAAIAAGAGVGAVLRQAVSGGGGRARTVEVAGGQVRGASTEGAGPTSTLRLPTGPTDASAPVPAADPVEAV